MSEDDFFHNQLDVDPSDSALRLLLAEWLVARGDDLAVGYRWLAEHGKHPYRAHTTWDWWNADSHNSDVIRLPNSLWELLPSPPVADFPRCKEWSKRRSAEEAVGKALPVYWKKEG